MYIEINTVFIHTGSDNQEVLVIGSCVSLQQEKTVLIKEGEELFGPKVRPVSKRDKKSVNAKKKVKCK